MFRFRTFVAFVTFVVIALPIWAAAAAARIEPCLVTPAELEEATGIVFVEDTEGVAECSYVIADNTEQDAFVSIQLLESPSKKEAKAFFKEQRRIPPDPESIKGIGNAAFYADILGDVATFRKGKVVVVITLEILAADPVSHRDEVVAIAEAAADNL